jgi:hypothetical protein
LAFSQVRAIAAEASGAPGDAGPSGRAAPPTGAGVEGQPPAVEQTPTEPGRRLRVDEMPAIEVVGRRPSELREEDLVGPYGQPRWTAHRRFPTTRIYVIPPWQVDVEYWLRTKVPRDGSTEFEHRQEVEIGLPYRFQFDFYLIETHEDGSDTTFIDQSFELRYAFADWDKIPFNPTAYFEYIHRTQDRPEKIEVKLLFGDELATRWHWGMNFIWEQDLGGARETVVEWTPAISYTIIDEVLSVGAEGKFEVAAEKPNRNKYVENLRLGPSIQWRPFKQLHIDIAPLFGLNEDSRKADIFFVAGWEF